MAKLELLARVEVVVPGRQYPVIICRNGLKNYELLRPFVTSGQVLIVTNQTVAPLYLKLVQSVFTDLQCQVLILPDGEQFKNKENLFAIYDLLIEHQHHRDTTLIALGGGVIGDLVGFAASTYQRGVSFIQIPTTLLAQIDASVGGKTAINHPRGKNMIGSFYQPQAVIIDLATLTSLPKREFQAGLAEMIKYGLLAGGSFFIQLKQALYEGLNAKHPKLPDLIAECCRIKAQFVEDDEKEEGMRVLLNLGHTFAHALEAYTHYQKWLHGEAVAIGLFCAAIMSWKAGLCEKNLVEEVQNLISSAGLSYKIPLEIDLDKLTELMGLDKKIKSNCLRFVVIQKPGLCYLSSTITKEFLKTTLINAVAGV